jgi:multidrug efflux pump subunit AcrA (membrane-fusion protein)
MTDESTVDDNLTDADYAAAKQEAAEAEALVTALEDRVKDGDDTITPDQILAQESLSRFARLRLEATRRKLEKAKAKRRLDAANALHDEITAYAGGIGQKLANKMRAIEKAEQALVTLADQHDALIRSWRARAEALKIPVTDFRPMPPARDGHLALGTDGATTVLHAGRRKLELVEGETLLKHFRTHDDRAAVVAATEQMEAELPEPNVNYFYRGEGGGVIAKEEPYTDEEIHRLRLVKLTRKEASGE